MDLVVLSSKSDMIPYDVVNELCDNGVILKRSWMAILFSPLDKNSKMDESSVPFGTNSDVDYQTPLTPADNTF